MLDTVCGFLFECFPMAGVTKETEAGLGGPLSSGCWCWHHDCCALFIVMRENVKETIDTRKQLFLASAV